MAEGVFVCSHASCHLQIEGLLLFIPPGDTEQEVGLEELFVLVMGRAGSTWVTIPGVASG